MSATLPTPSAADYEAVQPFMPLLGDPGVIAALKVYFEALEAPPTGNAGTALFAALEELQKALATAHAEKAKGS